MPTTNVVIPNMVKGPASATDDTFVKYDGTTGKLIKDGVEGSDGGNGSADGGKVVQFLPTGAIQGRCDASFGVQGITVSGTGVIGRATGDGNGVSGVSNGIGAGIVSSVVGTGSMFYGVNGSADVFFIKNSGELEWTNATARANTRTNLGLGSLALQNNITTSEIASATLVTEGEGIASNDNDITIPTSAAVKAYADSVVGGGGGDAWSDPVDADILPDTDSTRTIGSALNRFVNAFLDALNVSGNITVGGTVDGRDVASDGSKLDGIEAGADVTDATNVAAAGAAMTANNLSDLASAGDARANLGLNTMAEQASDNVEITGGNISGITDLAVADGGTGASSAEDARVNLGLVIGTDVQGVLSEGAFANGDKTKLDGIAAGAEVNPTTQKWDMTIAVSDETTDLTTGTAKVTFRMPRAVTLTGVRASVNTAPVGSTIVVDINEGGSTILSTKLSIDASEKTSTTAATPAVISDSSLADDAEMTIDIDQVGSSTPGKGLKVTLLGTIAV